MRRARRWRGSAGGVLGEAVGAPRLVALHLAALGLVPLATQTGLCSAGDLERIAPEVLSEYEARGNALRELEAVTPPGDRDCLRFSRFEHSYGRQGLLVSPRLGFVAYDSGCCGDWMLDLGTARWQGEELELVPRFAPRSEPWERLACRLVLVPWGERQYLLGLDELDRFVNDINLGIFRERGGWAWHTEDGSCSPLVGHPELPAELATRLLNDPVVGLVLASTRIEDIDAHGRWQCTFDLTLDVGARAGLWVGMQLELVEDHSAFERAEVTSVAPERAHAAVRCLGAERHATPAPGWHASSRARSPW